ncbi:hypothetical protein ZIOFF_026025 [Zingiber officinale]|uniref:Splicing factor Cactin C-terminal domain-containing protein n=1 Tax=Zingiber officinale TaxID=94328 RepID=A0A8J5LEH2_ZINOF|nr:hypothetical protein ZIOFF_026025 [Zingiber officinale]
MDCFERLRASDLPVLDVFPVARSAGSVLARLSAAPELRAESPHHPAASPSGELPFDPRGLLLRRRDEDRHCGVHGCTRKVQVAANRARKDQFAPSSSCSRRCRMSCGLRPLCKRSVGGSMMKRKAVEILEPQQMNAKKVRTPTPQENTKLKAMRVMGATLDEGDALFGAGSEKPEYLNLIRTRFVWNKYNRTHYDYDNPPPKIAQGYKFNVFFPSLIDKSKVPQYTFEKDDNSNDTCLLRFYSGPPYQDIAFRIVNKDLEYSPKKGFMSTFDNGTLRLYFNFKHYPYR